MDIYTLILDFIDYKIHWNSFCPRMAGMAFKRSAVRSRLSPPKVLKTIGFQHFFLFLWTFWRIFRPLEFGSNLMHSRGVVMARISMRNVQKSTVEEYFSLYLSSAAAKGVKDKTLETYKNHFRSISKRMNTTIQMNRLTSQDLEEMILKMVFSSLTSSSSSDYAASSNIMSTSSKSISSWSISMILLMSSMSR